MNQTKRKILAYCLEKTITTTQIAATLQIKPSTVQTYLQAFIKNGLLREEKLAHYQFIPPQARFRHVCL
jgi:predicted ArsR family transcriptional regulator